MTITVFTSNQPRHLSLIRSLASVAETVYAVQECNTVFPGEVADFYRKTDVMQRYFQEVIRAEQATFGSVRFLPPNVRQLCIKAGDLNRLDLSVLDPALQSDHYVVFGASYIRPPLIDRLVANGALNIHMGTSPYYRGSSCNFWAAYDGPPEYVGATIHMLSKGLDSGAMLYHALPRAEPVQPFMLGMQAVKVAHDSLTAHLRDGTLGALTPVTQDRSQELRYTRNADFGDEVALHYLDNLPSPEQLAERLRGRDLSKFLLPYIA